MLGIEGFYNHAIFSQKGNRGGGTLEPMPIATAFKDGNSVMVFDEQGKILCHIETPKGEVVGYTPTVVSVRYENSIQLYDEKAKLLARIPAGKQS